MQAEQRIEMRAVDRTRNVFRAWACEVGTDLFGAVVVEVCFGRTGTNGRAVRRMAVDHADALRLVRRALRRRASAERRIGVGYQTTLVRGLDMHMLAPVAEGSIAARSIGRPGRQ